MAHDIWEALGIPPTSDQREIKKAYAKRSAACHPEEHPEEFDRLHKAYKAALAAAAFKREAAAKADSGAEKKAVSPEDNGGAKNKPASSEDHDGAKRMASKDHKDTPPKPSPAEEPAPQPAIPSIVHLVEKGMENEKAAAAAKLLEKLQALHASFPKSVNTNEKDMTAALQQLEELFTSSWFNTAGREPDFLQQLDWWLGKNRRTINRAEAVALFRAYHLNHYKTSSNPGTPYMDDIHRQVMQHALRYEKDMVALAGMEPLPRPQPKAKAAKSNIKWGQLLCLLLFAIAAIGFSCSQKPHTSKSNMDIYRKKIISNINQGSGHSTITVLGTPSEAGKRPDLPTAPSTGRHMGTEEYHRYNTIKRPKQRLRMLPQPLP